MATDNFEQLEQTVNRLIERHDRMRREKESIEKSSYKERANGII